MDVPCAQAHISIIYNFSPASHDPTLKAHRLVSEVPELRNWIRHIYCRTCVCEELEIQTNPFIFQPYLSIPTAHLSEYIQIRTDLYYQVWKPQFSPSY